jgi:hypothetical protein
MSGPPVEPKLYHIVHVDRLRSIVQDGFLWCDAEMARRDDVGSSIGMSSIKRRRLEELTLSAHPDLHVGDCVPFYFCPRSVMLYVIHRRNHPELGYKGGQEPIVHLEVDLLEVVSQNDPQRWAFTLANAGAYYLEDRSSLEQLDELDWKAIQSRDWQNCKEGKQAEFLVERCLPFGLVRRIGVLNRAIYTQVMEIITGCRHKPTVEILPEWYY